MSRSSRKAPRDLRRQSPAARGRLRTRRQPRAPDAGRTRCVLVFQGGGALGAYQAGTYEALDAHRLGPDWVAGISIGAVNAAIIAGNRPDERVARLRQFWREISIPTPPVPLPAGETLRQWWNEGTAAAIAFAGIPGFFRPRPVPPLLQSPGSMGALSFYDSSQLKATLERVVDFDRINARETRLSIGAVNVRTGNIAYFDSFSRTIGPEHVMASGALPPALPPVDVDGELYWDGGLVSNTPLQYVLDAAPHRDLLVFQVDLFGARGPSPRTLGDALEREKDIRYSSRTRLNTDQALKAHRFKTALRALIERLPPALRENDDISLLRDVADEGSVVLVHIIYRRRPYDGYAKDYLFSRAAMAEHWRAGREDVERSLTDPRWLGCSPTRGLTVLDLVPTPGGKAETTALQIGQPE